VERGGGEEVRKNRRREKVYGPPGVLCMRVRIVVEFKIFFIFFVGSSCIICDPQRL
jgi:hypothetical protein